MDKKSAVASFVAVQSLSFLGLILSGILWAAVSPGVVAVAIFGAFAIATLIWVPIFYLTTKYNQERNGGTK